MFEAIKKTHGGVDVCINNAGLHMPQTQLMDGVTEQWKTVLDVSALQLLITKIFIHSL